MPDAVSDAQVSGGKIDRSAFLYLDGTDKQFAQCGTCYAFNREAERCGLMGPKVDVDADDTCGAYLQGEWSGPFKLTRFYKPEELGFLKDADVRCENCKYGGADCALYVKLNEELPNLFDLDTKIAPRGCCNAWQEMKATIWIARHGATDHNCGGPGKDRVRAGADIPMTDAGRAAVEKTAEFLSDKPISLIYASSLSRALETAKIIAAVQEEPPKIIPSKELETWKLGPRFEGVLTTPAVIGNIKKLVENDTTVPPGGESFRAFIKRLLGFIEPIFDDVAKDGGEIAIVAHGRVVDVIDIWIKAGCDEECMRRDYAYDLADEPDAIPPAGVMRYEFEDGKWSGKVAYGDVSDKSELKQPEPNGAADQMKLPAPGGKADHAAVAYGPAKSNGQRCGVCEHFQDGKPAHCEIVKDPIYPSGYCERFSSANAGAALTKPANGAADDDAQVPPHQHALAIGSAQHLHNMGHIDRGTRDKIVATAKQRMAGR